MELEELSTQGSPTQGSPTQGSPTQGSPTKVSLTQGSPLTYLLSKKPSVREPSLEEKPLVEKLLSGELSLEDLQRKVNTSKEIGNIMDNLTTEIYKFLGEIETSTLNEARENIKKIEDELNKKKSFAYIFKNIVFCGAREKRLLKELKENEIVLQDLDKDIGLGVLNAKRGELLNDNKNQCKYEDIDKKIQKSKSLKYLYDALEKIFYCKQKEELEMQQRKWDNDHVNERSCCMNFF